MLPILNNTQKRIDSMINSRNMPNRRPVINDNYESNVKDMYIIGDLAGAPVIKLAMDQGYNVIKHISSLPGAKSNDPNVYDLVIVGSGGAGLNAALEAKARGFSFLVVEKAKIANTIENFPEKKWVYAEPDKIPPKGKLWLDGATKEDLITRWHQIVTDNQIPMKTEEGVESITKKSGIFDIKTSKGVYRAKRVIIATGQRGNPRKLNVPGSFSCDKSI